MDQRFCVMACRCGKDAFNLISMITITPAVIALYGLPIAFGAWVGLQDAAVDRVFANHAQSVDDLSLRLWRNLANPHVLDEQINVSNRQTRHLLAAYVRHNMKPDMALIVAIGLLAQAVALANKFLALA